MRGPRYHPSHTVHAKAFRHLQHQRRSFLVLLLQMVAVLSLSLSLSLFLRRRCPVACSLIIGRRLKWERVGSAHRTRDVASCNTGTRRISSPAEPNLKTD